MRTNHKFWDKSKNEIILFTFFCNFLIDSNLEGMCFPILYFHDCDMGKLINE